MFDINEVDDFIAAERVANEFGIAIPDGIAVRANRHGTIRHAETD